MRSPLFILLTCLMAVAPSLASANPKFIELEGKSTTPAAMFVQDVLEKAYAKIGLEVRYRQVPLARSFVEANSGRLDGLRARIGSVSDKYPNLVKIPFNLLDFKLVLVADRRVCGVCDLSQLTHVVTSRGLKAFEDYIADKPYQLNVTELTSLDRSLSMLAEGKVQAAILPDINIPDKYFDTHPHWVKHTLAVLPDYHYLHNKHTDLAAKLLQEFQNMQASGEMSRLRKQYGVPEVIPELAGNNLGEVSGIAGVWFDFTDSAEGTYWKMLSAIFDSQNSTFSHQVTNWKRAKQVFEDAKVDILVGAYQFEIGDNMLRSEMHIDYEWPVSAYGKDLDRLKKQIAGEIPGSVCYPLGYDFTEWLPETISNYEVTDFIDCERLFVAGRVDILMNYSIDLLPEITEQFPSIQVAEGKPLFLAFHNTERGKLLKFVFEKAFRQLIESGKLAGYYPDEAQFERANIIVKSEEPWAPAPVKKR